MPVNLFFPRWGLKGHSLRRVEREAKLVCDQCPVIEQCRTHAFHAAEPYGVWGGLSATERLNARKVDDSDEKHPSTRRIGPPTRHYLRPDEEYRSGGGETTTDYLGDAVEADASQPRCRCIGETDSQDKRGEPGQSGRCAMLSCRSQGMPTLPGPKFFHPGPTAFCPR
ncbi:hypothetical protein CH291_02585 [Rhodococcus sp. 14-1411-2a]|nr:hypothetical protein CH291_02585 [Rhodococcus sp. 14-1411-2a]